MALGSLAMSVGRAGSRSPSLTRRVATKTRVHDATPPDSISTNSAASRARRSSPGGTTTANPGFVQPLVSNRSATRVTSAVSTCSRAAGISAAGKMRPDRTSA